MVAPTLVQPCAIQKQFLRKKSLSTKRIANLVRVAATRIDSLENAFPFLDSRRAQRDASSSKGEFGSFRLPKQKRIAFASVCSGDQKVASTSRAEVVLAGQRLLQPGVPGAAAKGDSGGRSRVGKESHGGTGESRQGIGRGHAAKDEESTRRAHLVGCVGAERTDYCPVWGRKRDQVGLG